MSRADVEEQILLMLEVPIDGAGRIARRRSDAPQRNVRRVHAGKHLAPRDDERLPDFGVVFRSSRTAEDFGLGGAE